MNFPPLDSIPLLLLLSVPVLAGAVYYVAVALDLRTRGGRVQVKFFGLADLLFASVLAAYFVWGGMNSFLKQSAPASGVRIEQLTENLVLMLSIFGATVGFARGRGIPYDAFGMGAAGWSSAFFRSVMFLGLALPPVWAANLCAHYLFSQNTQEQELVTVFRRAAEEGNFSAVRLMCLSAVLIAPLMEETVFRGYFYSLAKPQIGAGWASVITSSFFAVSHGNVAAFPGLFVLSICLTVAFEKFGSLWVSVLMHSCFNAISLILIYLQSKGWLPQ
jgi:membrane protease YdiL (CAAX protease family)